MLRRLFKREEYTDAQKRQMEIVQHSYQIAAPLAPVPALLEFTHKKNGKYVSTFKPTPSKERYHLDYWISQLGRGLLRVPIEEIITHICAYQYLRSERPFWRSGYLDEPIQLLCEYLKSEFVTFSKYTSFEESHQVELKKITTMIDRLLASQDFLPTAAATGEGSVTGQPTIYSLLLMVQHIIKTKMQGVVDAGAADLSARKNLEQFSSECKAVIHHALLYLFYSLRNKKIPEDFSTDYLLRSDIPRFSEMGHTVSVTWFKYLILLMQPISVEVVPSTTGALLTDQRRLIRDGNINPFSLAALPRDLPDLSDPRNDFSDLYLLLWNKPGVKEIFQKLHMLIYEFWNFSIVLDSAYDLAGVGGNLLVYGFANAYFNGILSAADVIFKELQRAINELDMYLSDENRRIYLRNEKTDKPWCRNYQIAAENCRLLREDLTYCFKRMNALREAANAMSLADRLEQADKSFKGFQALASAYITRVSSLMDVAMVIAAPKKQFALPMETARGERARIEELFISTMGRGDAEGEVLSGVGSLSVGAGAAQSDGESVEQQVADRERARMLKMRLSQQAAKETGAAGAGAGAGAGVGGEDLIPSGSSTLRR